MAKRVTSEDIININEWYLEIKTYAGVARELGFSPSTIKKYVDPQYSNQVQVTDDEKDLLKMIVLKKIDKQIVDGITDSEKEKKKDLNLTPEEREGIEKLWKELKF